MGRRRRRKEKKPARRMLMNVVDPEEVRVAILGKDGLEDLYLERTGKGFQAGNIYKGRIQNVEPHLQAAFVELGGVKNGFLHVSDVIWPDGGYKGILKKKRGRRKPDKQAPIDKLLWKGQEVLVQITRESIGEKGPSLTTYVSIPGRYLVLMPAIQKRGVSKKIRDEKDRKELRRALDDLNPPDDMGFIIRTAGMNQGRDELKKDLDYLMRLWKALVTRTKEAKPPALIYEETDLVIRSVRDFLTEDVDELVIDRKEEYDRAIDFLNSVMPEFADKARLYTDPEPLFSRYGADKEIENVFSRTIELKGGGTLVIEPTEAMVAIDVNSGKYRGRDDSREMILSTNLDAAHEVARQIRLRDLGGLIMIDFIDMEQEEDRRKVEQTFRDALRRDKARMTVLPISRLGVMQMTRQRARLNLRSTVSGTCPMCRGTGMVKSPESVALDFVRELRRKFNERTGRLEARLHPKAASFVGNNKRKDIAGLETEYNSRVIIKTDMSLPYDEMVFRWIGDDESDEDRD